jgi:hypothetical protein
MQLSMDAFLRPIETPNGGTSRFRHALSLSSDSSGLLLWACLVYFFRGPVIETPMSRSCRTPRRLTRQCSEPRTVLCLALTFMRHQF